MKRYLALILIVVISLVIWAENFPLSEVVPGLKGIGKTVFSGTKVEEFPVEILSIIPGDGTVSDFILIKVGGKALELGGVVEGMSGSPVYISGKLLGAISYGFSDYGHSLALVTPISEMEKLLSLPETDFPLEKLLPNTTLRPLSSQIVASGFGERGRTFLGKQLGLTLAKSSLGNKGTATMQVEPGSALGVLLVTGDITVGGFGTLTTIYPDGRFLAFGHPLLKRGQTAYLASTSFIHTIVQGQSNSFKLASFGEKIGLISEDRGAGILGSLVKSPQMVPVKVVVKEKDLNRVLETKVLVVPDNMLFDKLAISAILEGFDRGIDRVGAGSSKIKFTIQGNNLPYTLERENCFYSYADIAALSISELSEILDLIIFNDYYKVEPTEIVVLAEFTEAKNTAVITSATPALTQVNPGQDLEVVTQLRPFRGETETVKLLLPIPEDITPGKVHVVVRPGVSIPTYEPESVSVSEKLELQSEERKSTPSSQEAKDWEKVLKDFLNREKNNELVAEFYPPYSESLYENEDSNETLLPVQVRLTTDYVMEGEIAFDLEILESSLF